MKTFRYIITIVTACSIFTCQAQQDTSLLYSNAPAKIDSSKQRDLIDILLKVLNKNTPDDKRRNAKKLIFSAVPAIGYSLSTGFALAIISNVAFYTSASHQENLSVIGGTVFYDSKTQKVFISRSEIWADKNRYKVVTDITWERFPEDTYGLGTFTTDATLNHLDYLHVKAYATLFRKITPDLYAGGGYNLDDHYDITAGGNANNSLSDFMKYGQTSRSVSSGLNLSFLYDSRRNPINPINGGYASLVFRNSFTFLGSDNNWRELLVDLRRYVRVSPASNNILAFWGMAAFTSGFVPYLDLPATAFDMYSNAGRGYEKDRFRGRNMLYAESEYRFGLSRNGLFGAVVFANAQSFSELQSNRFEKIAPAAGAGIRIKINKHSNTNIGIDYADGVYGSHGFFAELGEVF